jgi:Holliday junction resolvase RusA-like endonuclease
MDGRVMFDEPLMLDLQVDVPIPRSWSKRKQNAAMQGLLLPGSRPDLTNVLKLCEDACTAIVFRDDSLVCIQRTHKHYSRQPGIKLTVRTVEHYQRVCFAHNKEEPGT